MGKIILQENITPEGYCDHRAFVADEELMKSVNDLLRTVDTAIFGRVTFQLFENYWPSVWQSKNAPDSDVEFRCKSTYSDKVLNNLLPNTIIRG